MVPLAYIAQHVWEVGASVFAVLLVGQGLFYLITGIRMPWAEGMSPRAVRTRAGLSVLLGVGDGFAAFLSMQKQPGVHGGNGWGGTPGIVILCVWVALMLAFFALQFMKVKPPKR